MLVSELGSDFTKWPTVKHPQRRAGLRKRPEVSELEADRRQSAVEQDAQGQEPRGDGPASGLLGPDAQPQRVGRYLRWQRARLGAPKAITATAHKLAHILYNLIRHGVAYMKREEAAYAEQVRERLEKQWQRRAHELGFELKKIDKRQTAPTPTVA